jgi:hypothetical protein
MATPLIPWRYSAKFSITAVFPERLKLLRLDILKKLVF